MRFALLRKTPLLVAWILMAATMLVIASTYIGDASSPYDTCLLSGNRAVSCTSLRSLNRQAPQASATERLRSDSVLDLPLQ